MLAILHFLKVTIAEELIVLEVARVPHVSGLLLLLRVVHPEAGGHVLYWRDSSVVRIRKPKGWEMRPVSTLKAEASTVRLLDMKLSSGSSGDELVHDPHIRVVILEPGIGSTNSSTNAPLISVPQVEGLQPIPRISRVQLSKPLLTSTYPGSI